MQNALMEHSALLLTCTKLPPVFKTFVLSIFEWPLLFVSLFVALRPKSTAMVIAGRSVHLTTLFPGQA